MADLKFTVIPDIVANCGMARAFSYLMCDSQEATSAPLFRAVDKTIADTIREIERLNRSEPFGLLGATLAYALERLKSDVSV